MGGDRVERALAAYEGREWSDACEAYRAAEAAGERLAGIDLERWAYAALWVRDSETAVATFERAEDAYRTEGNRERAAVTCIAAAQVALWTGRNTEATAAMQRIPRLLDGLPECEAHALLCWVAAYQAAQHDAADALPLWEQAVEIARRVGSASFEAASLCDLGRDLLQTGDRERGLKLVEQAAALALSADVAPLVAGHVLCGTIWAFRDLGDWRTAGQWADVTWRWVARTGISIYPGVCRFHRCEIIRIRGELDAAEREALAGCEEMENLLQPRAGYAYRELGEIRFRRGDLAGAESAFEKALGFGLDPQPGLARLRLAQGETDGAVRGLEDALTSRGSRALADRPFVLAVLVTAATRAGDVERAKDAAEELAAIADECGTAAHRAAAAQAAGEVALASGDLAAARTLLHSAWELWSEVEAPFEAASARVVLARVNDIQGDASAARLNLAAARTVFERIGAQLEVTRVARLLDTLEAADERAPVPDVAGATRSPAADGRHDGPPRIVFQKEGEYWTVGRGDGVFRLKDVKGLRYIAYLLAHPDIDFHALDLVRAVEPPPAIRGDAALIGSGRAPAQTGLGPALDSKAVQAYKRRLTDLREDADQADSMNDPARAAAARREIDALTGQLAGARGLGGRARPVGSDAERARVKVTRVIKHAIKRIDANDADVGHVLRTTIRTGTFCAYVPPPDGGPSWTL